ncbi:MAG TPA: hypothetical protein VKE27_00015 [Candidatus Dormibacteraeota bacterium]|nr:hypothetical protein [Candidatus Dormibacteraeota bacterium]
MSANQIDGHSHWHDRKDEEFIEGDKPGVNGQRERRASRATPATATARR